MSAPRFVVDMARCVGCFTCSVACKDRAGLGDDLDILTVEVNEGGHYPRPSLSFRVVHCFHCARPPCVAACPTEALHQGDDGLVHFDAAACIGCGACIPACPFGAIVMRPTGIVAKCDACADEVAAGIEPTCVRACPVGALAYGVLPRVPSGREPDPAPRGAGIEPAVLYLRYPTQGVGNDGPDAVSGASAGVDVAH